MTNLRPEFGFVIQYVSDINASRRFYEDVFGLQAQRVAPKYVQFPHFALAGDESMGGTNEPEVYWLVDDAQAAFAELSSNAEVSMPLRELPFGKVFGIKDPDGEPRYVLELSANRPSQAV